MPETTRLKIKLLIHDLKAPLAVIDLGARSLKERQATYGPLTQDQESALDHLLEQTESLRREVNSALSSEKGIRTSPTERMKGLLKRLTAATGRSETRPPEIPAETRPLDVTRKLLQDIETHLYGLGQTVDLLENKDPAPGVLTVQQKRIFSRLKRSVKLSRILIANAKILTFPHRIESRPRKVQLRDAIRRPLVELFDLYSWEVGDQADEYTAAEKLKDLAVKVGLIVQIETDLLDKECVFDKDKFCQVMVNLLLNAFKFRKETVWLSGQDLGSHLLIAVSDDGDGMSEEVRKAVLAGRFQAGPDQGLPIQSHGIGLAGAHVLIREMGGELAIESTLGKGSKVSITLPCFKGVSLKTED